MTEKPQDMVVKSIDAAKILGISVRLLNILARDGWIQKEGAGKWKIGKVVSGYLAYKADNDRQTSKSAAASRVTDARTREIELKIAQKEKTLISIDEVSAAFDEITGAYLTMLSGLPVRITRNKRERDRIEMIIDQEKTRLSKSFLKSVEAVAPSGGNDSTDSPDRTG